LSITRRRNECGRAPREILHVHHGRILAVLGDRHECGRATSHVLRVDRRGVLTVGPAIPARPGDARFPAIALLTRRSRNRRASFQDRDPFQERPGGRANGRHDDI
jgi:hypothetical protein